MENLHEQGKEGYFQPDQQKKYGHTNQFLKEVSSAMNLPPEAGAKVARCLINIIAERLSAEEAKDFISQLPIGLKEEVSENDNVGSSDKSLNAQEIKRRITETAEVENAEQEEIARSFWGYMTAWFNDNPSKKEGLSSHILTQLPKDVERLFGRIIEQ